MNKEENLYVKVQENSFNLANTEINVHKVFYDREEEYEKIFVEHIDKITTLEEISNYSKFIAAMSFLSFLIMLAIRLQQYEELKNGKQKPLPFSLYYLLIPSYFTVLAMTIYLNSFLYLKELYDRVSKKANNEHEEGCSSSTILTFVCLNVISLSVLIYLTLILFKIEKNFSFGFNFISIPIYLVLVILTCYLVFFLPAFLLNKYYMIVFLLFYYLLSTYASFFLINVKLDNRLPDQTYLYILGPFMIALVFHALYAIFCIFIKTEPELFSRICTAIGLLLVLAGYVMIPLKVDGIANFPYYLPILMFILASPFLIPFISLYLEVIKKEIKDK